MVCVDTPDRCKEGPPSADNETQDWEEHQVEQRKRVVCITVLIMLATYEEAKKERTLDEVEALTNGARTSEYIRAFQEVYEKLSSRRTRGRAQLTTV
ncbi:hypothetical protein LTR37_001679 [Vermiconidia calcicola]|uniref:Uncharacterized protein n=1 Tax=Vermiconidia calcicola TaxID=1690605 RepID=A0ACC3NUI9_9PEZI|nr:hypothetical protein LTR37_001679 [Vermiconidia calcicola]